MITLALGNVKKYYGATEVLDNVTFEVQEGEKVGIVGKNGCGKSTLLKVIMGLEEEYTGDISFKKGIKTGYVDQIPEYEQGLRVIDVLNMAFKVQYEILENMKKLEKNMENLGENQMEKTLKKYMELQQSYENLGGYRIEERLSKVCVGLNMTDDFKERQFDTLSGGEKTTVLIGKLLLQEPDLLLLDEPSNHLDLKAIEWLEDYLRSYEGTVLIVSHDRYFLDRVVTKVVEIEDMKSKTYSGNYSAYAKQKETDHELQQECYEVQQKKIKAMEKTIKDLRDWGARGDNVKFFKRAASMQKRLNKIDKIDKPKGEEESIKADIHLGERSGKDVIRLSGGFKSFGPKVILNNAGLHLRYGEKVALIGINGCGKSTLLKMVLNAMTPEKEPGECVLDAGKLELGASLKAGCLPQNVVFNNEEDTLLECFREDMELPEGKARQYLARFLFSGETIFKKVSNLSGGERSRLMLAKLLFKEVNFLVLDEPTNHLDIASRESLEENLKRFKGTILFVSHDRCFINALCSRVVELSEGVLTSYEGNYEYYKAKSYEKNLKEKPSMKKAESKQKKVMEEKSKNKNMEKKAGLLENKIDELEKQIHFLEEEMSKCMDHVKLNRLYALKEQLGMELEEAMRLWIEVC